MKQFAEFDPIFSDDLEKMKDYYTTNNIDVPNNPYFKDMLGLLPKSKIDLLTNEYTPNDELTIQNKPLIKDDVKKTFNNIISNLIKSKPEAKLIPETKTPVASIQDNIKIPEVLQPKNSKFKKIKSENKEVTKLRDKYRSDYSFFIPKEIDSLNINNIDKRYLKKLAFKESSYNPYITNSLGYYGLYQFGKPALDTLKLTKDMFDDTKVQHKSALKLANINEKILKNYIIEHKDTTFNGVPITLNGIRAAAHLLGANTVKDFFDGTQKTSFAKKGFKDGYGTHISEYFKEFK